MKTLSTPTPISFHQAKYLKHIGGDIKVSIKIREKFPFIYITDFEFTTFASALNFMQNALPRTCDLEQEVRS